MGGAAHPWVMRVLALVAVVLLAGCSSAPVAPVAPPPSVARSIYLDTVYSGVRLERSPATDESLVRVAGVVCQGFDDGLGWVQMVAAMREALGSLSAAEDGQVIAAAVATMCPRHRDKLPG